ncbi:MAG: sugar phosphate isomerase/epimerase [Planctomycetes bacterium]|nr:sugar phosphate isomerase/epimerase [Planctomycetota bacterium]
MKPLEIGVFATLKESPEATAQWVKSMGVNNIQLLCPPEEYWKEPKRSQFTKAFADAGITLTVIFIHFPGESYADIPTIQRTVGLVQKELCKKRLALALRMADFAKTIGVPIVAAHIGFVPEHASDPAYREIVAAVQGLCDHCAKNGQRFALETGQETAEVLLRFIQDVRRPNLGVNFDPANMILYGTGEPIAAMDVVKKHIVSCHCKDGIWPKEKGVLGTETPLGKGQVGIPNYFKKLKEIGYQGPVTIEREISGEKQKQDIIESIRWLRTLA